MKDVTLIYAHPSSLVPDWIPATPEWMDADPQKAFRMIRSASSLVTFATRFSRYPVDVEGYPTNPKHVDAFRDAVCKQVAIWDGAGIDPDKGAAGQAPRASSQSAGGGSVSYEGVLSVEALGQIATTLCHESWLILNEAGLTVPRISYR